MTSTDLKRPKFTTRPLDESAWVRVIVYLNTQDRGETYVGECKIGLAYTVLEIVENDISIEPEMFQHAKRVLAHSISTQVDPNFAGSIIARMGPNGPLFLPDAGSNLYGEVLFGEGLNEIIFPCWYSPVPPFCTMRFLKPTHAGCSHGKHRCIPSKWEWECSAGTLIQDREANLRTWLPEFWKLRISDPKTSKSIRIPFPPKSYLDFEMDFSNPERIVISAQFRPLVGPHCNELVPRWLDRCPDDSYAIKIQSGPITHMRCVPTADWVARKLGPMFDPIQMDRVLPEDPPNSFSAEEISPLTHPLEFAASAALYDPAFLADASTNQSAESIPTVAE